MLTKAVCDVERSLGIKFLVFKDYRRKYTRGKVAHLFWVFGPLDFVKQVGTRTCCKFIVVTLLQFILLCDRVALSIALVKDWH